MSLYKLIVSLIVFLIITGCQYSNQNTASDTIREPVNNINIKKKPIEFETSGSNHNVVSNDQVDREQTISKEDKNSKASTRKKIDQALELCNYAQQMWEEGKLEEALSNLDSAYYSILEIDSQTFPEFNQQKEDIRFLISKRILEIYASRQIVTNGQHNEIPIILNKYVKKEIKRLTGPERNFFVQSLKRSQRYRPYIVEQLKKAGLPENLSWLPLIESGFKIRALSKARALGLWQFIPSTGYKFGLSRNYYIDERLDPEKATRAAIAYLKELHNLFGDWTTALAAYNCGESRVLSTIRKQKINYLDNFWDLFQSLPKETSLYVPRFLATLYIMNNLNKYNIKVDQSLSPLKYKTYEIKKRVKLKDIAKAINVNSKILEDLNPELRYALLPPETYQLKIPDGKIQLFLSKIDTIKTYSPPSPPRTKYVYHRVRKGDTLSKIARKYKTSVRAISRTNHINKRHKIIVGKMLKMPKSKSYISNKKISSRQKKPRKILRYKVRRGDNLWIIARKFGTTTKAIRAVNKLRNTRLRVGQRLYITSSQNYIKKPQKKIKAKKGNSTYRVKSGDNLFLIAKKYNMNLNRFLALNNLNKKSTIFPGQKLIVK